MDTNMHKNCQCGFGDVFNSVQLCVYYVLYAEDGCDFSLDKVKNVNKFMHELNNRVDSDDMANIYLRIYTSKGIDLAQLANDFPMRIKLNMYKRKIKSGQMKPVLKNCTEAIELLMILTTEVLIKHYRFSADKLRWFWHEVEEFARMYTNKIPLMDKHVLEFFENECGLKIER